MPDTTVRDNQNFLDKTTQTSDSALNAVSSSMREQIEELSKVVASISSVSLATSLEKSKIYSKNLSEIVETVQGSIPSIPLDIQDVIVPLQSQVFDAIKNISEKLSSVIPQIDFSNISEAFKKAYSNISGFYTKILSKTRWPLYLVDKDPLVEEIFALKDVADSDALPDRVYSIARKYLGVEWAREVENRWLSLDIIDGETKDLLSEALNHHISQDFYGCTAMLMCLLNGFIEEFGGTSFELSDIDQNALAKIAKIQGWSADVISKVNCKRRSVKCCFIVLIFRMGAGDVFWEAACSYIFETVLTSDYDKELAAHNPLRNKICHGEQVNYGTWEHSIKAILVTDLILQMCETAIASC